MKEIAEQLIGLIFALGDLLGDGRAFVFDLFVWKAGVEEDIGEQVKGERQVFAQAAGVVADVLFASKGVERAADRVDVLRDLGGAAPCRAFEEEVFQEVGDAVLVVRFIARAALNPYADGGRGHTGDLLGQQAEPIVENRAVDHPSSFRRPCAVRRARLCG